MIGAREVIGVLRLLSLHSLRHDFSFSSVVQPYLLDQTSQATILLCLLPTYLYWSFPFDLLWFHCLCFFKSSEHFHVARYHLSLYLRWSPFPQSFVL